MADNNVKQKLPWVPASLPPEALDQLCDMIIAKLQDRNTWGPAFQAGCRGFESLLPLHLVRLAEVFRSPTGLTYIGQCSVIFPILTDVKHISHS